MTDTGTGFILCETRVPCAAQKGRYEYRVWPPAPHPAVSILHRSWALDAAERRTDVYLLQAGRAGVLVKLRNRRRLEIKCRGVDVGTVQHWTMPLSTDFPLTVSERAELSAALAWPGGPSAETGLSPARLLARLDGCDATIVPLTVDKSRLLFRQGGCRAEICRVAAHGWSGTTIALEAPELPAIALAIDRLRLGSLENCSYGEVLERLVGAYPVRRRKLAKAGTEATRYA